MKSEAEIYHMIELLEQHANVLSTQISCLTIAEVEKAGILDIQMKVSKEHRLREQAKILHWLFRD